MPSLGPPTVRVRESFLAAMREFQAEGRGVPSDNTSIGAQLRERWPQWNTGCGFAEYVDELLAQPREGTPRPEGWVPWTTLWYVEGEEYLGGLAIRHRLTPHLLEYGGHVGYDVRRSARRRGHATAMLRQALPVARGLGLERILLTCDVGNIASRRVIEVNGGVLEDQCGVKLRYWIPTPG
ncbi:MAG: GNAT family N-acetyltransferase [Geodermatophilaceae bacterium]|jgi:predicted acetyltransferase